ncbi:MAG: DUF3899 domain-containing protein [Sphaerochaetaceae bacterium]|jgi:hypothetical protein|nr:DUF3899 domain-containing protein [Sphaerochaetaceae bacterium]
MDDNKRGFISALLWGLAISVAAFFFASSKASGILQRLCDSFFVAGVLVTGLGGLSFARNQGLFDMMGFGVKMVLHIHLTPTQKDRGDETLIEYKERKSKTRKSAKPMLLGGLVYLVLAFIMLAAYFIFS